MRGVKRAVSGTAGPVPRRAPRFGGVSGRPAAPLTARGNRRSILAMTLTITPSGQACGARVTGVDLTRPLDVETVANISTVWLDHHVLAFPDPKMSETDLERFKIGRASFRDRVCQDE